MRTIMFKVNQQRIKNTNSICHVYKGTDNYLNLKFDFNDDWDACIIGISFVREGGKEIVRLLKDNSCVVPKEAFDKTQLCFYLVGKTKDYRIETQKFIIKVGD